MSDKSSIEWTDATWQVTAGCSKVAQGCKNCYAIKDAHRMAGNPNPKISEPRKGLTRKVGSQLDWTGVVRTMPQNLTIPLHWTRGRRIFVNSNSDLFHEDIPFGFIAAVFGIAAACPQHTLQVLTKRPARAVEFYRWVTSQPEPLSARYLCAVAAADIIGQSVGMSGHEWPLPNVWIGTSISTQADADREIPHLLQAPAAVRFLSVEPLIEGIDVAQALTYTGDAETSGAPALARMRGIDWVIVGGESGPGARACNVEWIRSIIRQCAKAGVPCFVKQLGSRYVDELNGIGGAAFKNPPNDCVPRIAKLKDRKGGDMTEWPKDLRVREFPKVQQCACVGDEGVGFCGPCKESGCTVGNKCAAWKNGMAACWGIPS